MPDAPAGIPITPENAPPGTWVKYVDDLRFPTDKLKLGRIYTVAQWEPWGEVRITGFFRTRWLGCRFVLADPPAVDPEDLPHPGTGRLLSSSPILKPAYKREGKPDYSYLVRPMTDGMVRVLEFGGTKHGRDNYLTNPLVTDQEIIAAARRHALMDPAAIDDGPGGSGQTHGDAAMANFAMLAHRRAVRKGTP